MYSNFLNITEIWILIVLGNKPGHIYGLAGRIAGASLMQFQPSVPRVAAAVKQLNRRGLVVSLRSEETIASPRAWRDVYDITEAGWRRLRAESMAYGQLQNVIDGALTRRAMYQLNVRQAEALAAAYQANQAGP
ncbi:MAG TPA: hypothetical protein VI322_02250 [Candidatus Saccharimonadia bacterium]